MDGTNDGTRPLEIAHENAKALDAFVGRKAEIDAMLARFAAFSDEHFGYTPDEINWGRVGTLASYAEPLQRITDAPSRRASTPSDASDREP